MNEEYQDLEDDLGLDDEGIPYPEDDDSLKKQGEKEEKKVISQSYKDRNIMGKEEIIKKVARRARFTKSNVREILDAFIEVIGEAVAEERIVMIPKFFKIYVKTLEDRTLWIKWHKRYERVAESKRLNIKFMEYFRKKYFTWKYNKQYRYRRKLYFLRREGKLTEDQNLDGSYISEVGDLSILLFEKNNEENIEE